MRFVLGVFTLCACMLWIGYVGLTVLAVAEPSIGRAAVWLAATPVMALCTLITVRSMDRLAANT